MSNLFSDACGAGSEQGPRSSAASGSDSGGAPPWRAEHAPQAALQRYLADFSGYARGTVPISQVELRLLELGKAVVAETNPECVQLDYLGPVRYGRTKQEARRAPKAGYVYLMKRGREGFVKIGFSTNPKARERTLQAQDPLLELVAAWPGTQADEAALHRRFAKQRIRGEWFRLTPCQLGKLKGAS